MKYFSPSYWFKLWVLSAPLFNDKTQGINARLIDNQLNIKNWASKNTNDVSLIENQVANLANNQTDFINYQTHLDTQVLVKNITSIPHKHHHEKSRNRHKRDATNTITTLAIALLIRGFWDRDNSQYLASLDGIRDNLIQEGIVQRVSTNSPSTSTTSTSPSFIFDPNLPVDNSHLVIMPVVTTEEGENESQRISLVLTARCLYLQGFILTDNNGTQHYFHFAGNDIVNRMDNISSENTYNLGFKGDYISLGGNAELTWDDIHRSFQYINDLTSFQNYRNNRNNIFRGESNNREARRSLVNIILAASESLRTVSIRNHLGNIISNRNSINWRTDIQPQASNWNTNSLSSDTTDIAILSPNAIGTIEPNISDQPSTSRGTSSSKPAWYSKTKEKKEEVCSVKKKDKNRNRGTRSIDDCLIINSIAILAQDSSIGPTEAKKGTMWMATNKGVWLKYRDGDYPTKINNIDESVKFIDIDHQGSAYAIAHSGNFYYISISGWNFNADKSTRYIQRPVNCVLILKNNLGTYNKGDLFYGTNDGVYFQRFGANTLTKINNIDESVKFIDIDHQGGTYFIANSGNFYYNFPGDVNADKSTRYIQRPVNCVLILKNNSGTYNKGDLFYGTNDGVYFQRFGANTLTKINNINGIIEKIYFNYELSKIFSINSNFQIRSIDKQGNVHDELRRKRENVEIHKNKWTEDFSKSINQEQYLLVTTDNINSIANNITSI